MNDEIAIRREVSRRRTFAIISHPDAGKTTLTEKLLLYGGAIEVAGAVRGRKTAQAARSDWMELEKQRGISVSSTVLGFEYAGCQVNLLDTPGHHDFSEDTYRTLMAADCAVMVIDLAKGVETQTEKLFEVCALRQIPVLTFVNKVDRRGKDALSILDEIEEKFRIRTVPHNWPIGTGPDFRGVVDLDSQSAHLFETRNNQRQIAFRSVPFDKLEETNIPSDVIAVCQEEVALIRETCERLDGEGFLAGKQTPVFFGSALTNYGVEHFLRGFLALCPPPGPRASDQGPVEASRGEFSGFVFKIQANLDPRHRDRVAFVRVCSGRFQRDMEVIHPRTAKKLRLSRAHRVFGQDRVTMDEAFPGDVIGLVNPGEFQLGDTICEGKPINFEPLPQFSPEHFAILRTPDTSRRKQFHRGLDQLIEEGAIQMFLDTQSARREPMLAAVGELQFDVVRYRLEIEYNTPTEIEWLPYKLARWISGQSVCPKELRVPSSAVAVQDQLGFTAILFRSQWDANYFQGKNPDLPLTAVRLQSSTQNHSAQYQTSNGKDLHGSTT